LCLVCVTPYLSPRLFPAGRGPYYVSAVRSLRAGSAGRTGSTQRTTGQPGSCRRELPHDHGVAA
jgi:hypothetical protein